MIWPWSKKAVQAFWKYASVGKKRFQIREGLDAALAEDLEHLTPTMARYWVKILTSIPERTFEVTTIHFTVEDDKCTVKLPVTEAMLLSLLALDDDEPDAGIPAGTEDPIVPPLEGQAEEPIPEAPLPEPSLWKNPVYGATSPDGWDRQ